MQKSLVLGSNEFNFSGKLNVKLLVCIIIIKPVLIPKPADLKKKTWYKKSWYVVVHPFVYLK